MQSLGDMYGFEIERCSADYRLARVHERDRPGELTCLAYAAIHPLHLMVQAAGAIAALLTFPWLVLVTAPVVGTATIARLRRCEDVRASARHDHEMRRRREAEAMRAAVLAHMNDEHRVELEELELLVDLLRERAGARASAHLVLDRHLEIEELLAAYTRLAVAHRDIERRLALTASDFTVNAPARAASSPELRALEEQRASLANRRERLHRRARERLARIELELAVVADTVRLLHEQTIVACPEAGAAGDAADTFVAEIDGYLDALAELDEPHEPSRESAATS